MCVPSVAVPMLPMPPFGVLGGEPARIQASLRAMSPLAKEPVPQVRLTAKGIFQPLVRA